MGRAVRRSMARQAIERRSSGLRNSMWDVAGGVFRPGAHGTGPNGATTAEAARVSRSSGGAGHRRRGGQLEWLIARTAPWRYALERGYTIEDFAALRAYVQRAAAAVIARTYDDPHAAAAAPMERRLKPLEGLATSIGKREGCRSAAIERIEVSTPSICSTSSRMGSNLSMTSRAMYLTSSISCKASFIFSAERRQSVLGERHYQRSASAQSCGTRYNFASRRDSVRSRAIR